MVTHEDGERKEDRHGLFVLISRLAPVVAIVNDAWQYVRFDENGEEIGRGERNEGKIAAAYKQWSF